MLKRQARNYGEFCLTARLKWRRAELGLSNQLIKSITGHSCDSEVSRYTREADQERMAEIAAGYLANGSNPDWANHQQVIESGD